VAICEKAMAREIERRYASMEELASDLEAWIDRRPIRASAPSVRHALRLFAERHRAAVVTAAAGTGLLLASVALFVKRITQERDEKERARAEAQERGDTMAVAALLAVEKELWPAVPARVLAMDDWLKQVADLESRMLKHGGRQAPRDTTQGFEAVRSSLRTSDERLVQFATLLHLRDEVVGRRAVASNLERDSLGALEAWGSAISEIVTLPAYAGLRLVPQLGLVPLERDVDSGLWQFWFVASGTRPPLRGEMPRKADSGMTLILLPGGTARLGSPQTDPPPDPLEAPHTLEIGAFWMSKYEVTQGQWLRVMGSNPSRVVPGAYEGIPATKEFPVEGVSWMEARQFCDRLAVELPTQVQWEYAARAGAWELHGYGPTIASLEEHENVLDLGRSAPGPGIATWIDRHVLTAPVGAYRPNAYGLHDCLGNVSEWCADEFGSITPVRIGQPERGTRAFRGGSFAVPLRVTRPSYVQWDGPGGSNHTLGLRVALPLRTGA